MKRVFMLFTIMFFVTGVNTGCQNLKAAKEAFKEYKKEALIDTRTEYEMSRKVLKKFVGSTAVPNIMKVEFDLESSEPAEDDQLNLVVLETIHLEHENMAGKMKIKKKHYVMMAENKNGAWESVDIEIEELD
jgi:hypothetical protein